MSKLVPQTPQQVKGVESEERSATTVRRPRNREVTSRYKLSIQTAVNRKFPNPHGDRLSSSFDMLSPKCSHNTHRRHPSPSDSRVSIGSGDAQPSNACFSMSTPRQPMACSELLWPPSSRALSTSVECLQPSNILQKRTINGGRDINQVPDHTLRPTPNTVQKKKVLQPKVTFAHPQNLDQSENARPLDNIVKSDHSRLLSSNMKMCGAALSKSVDLSSDRGRPLNKTTSLLAQASPIYGSSRAPRPLSSSLALYASNNEEGQGFPKDLKKGKTDMQGRRGPLLVKSLTRDSITKCGLPMMDLGIDDVKESSRQTNAAAEQVGSDSLSLSDCMPDRDTNATDMRVVRGTSVPARFWQDSANRSIRSAWKSSLQSSMLELDLADAMNKRPYVRYTTPMSPESFSVSNSSLNEAPSPPWTAVLSEQYHSDYMPSQQPAKLARTSSYPRSTLSPVKSRVPLPSMPRQTQRPTSAAVMLTFGADNSKRGKSQMEESHSHRILHNRLLQWRFVNGRAEAAFEAQASAVQKVLYNACAKLFELRASTTTKKLQLQQSRQSQRLNALVSVQIPALEAWSDLQDEHTHALTGSIDALQAAIVRVPVTGAKVDTLSVKDVIDSASDVIDSVENSVNYLLPRAQHTSLSISELASVVAHERALLEECTGLVAIASALQMQESSLRAQFIQLEHERAQALRAHQQC